MPSRPSRRTWAWLATRLLPICIEGALVLKWKPIWHLLPSLVGVCVGCFLFSTAELFLCCLPRLYVSSGRALHLMGSVSYNRRVSAAVAPSLSWAWGGTTRPVRLMSSGSYIDLSGYLMRPLAGSCCQPRIAPATIAPETMR